MAATALLFPGQSARNHDLLAYAKSLENWLEMTEIINAQARLDVRAIKEDDYASLNSNTISSILTLAVSALCLSVLQRAKVKFDYVAGYSVGQYSAMHAAGVLSIAEMFSIVRDRCDYMNDTPAAHGGVMLSVFGLSDNVVADICREVSTHAEPVGISNYNAPGQLTIAGTAKAVCELEDRLLAAGATRTLLLPLAGAWHCGMLNDAVPKLMSRLDSVHFSQPAVPIIDNVTGALMPGDSSLLRRQLGAHLTSPVCWRQGIEILINHGVDRFIEVGYGNTLTKFGVFINRKVSHLTWSEAL